MNALWHGVSFAFRNARKNRGFRGAAILCLTAASILLCVSASNSQQSAAGVPPDAPFEIKDVIFDSSGVSLSGRLFAPRRGKYPVVVYVTGSGDQDVNEGAYPQILAKAFAQSGVGLFSYDKRGVGKSQGTYSETRFDQRAQDTVAALAFVRSLPGVDSQHVGMFGISQGCWVVAMAAQRAKDAALVILVSPAGVSPKRQVEFYLRNEWRRVGMRENDITKASALHEVLFHYFTNGQEYELAQSAVSRAGVEGWLDEYRQAGFREEVPKTGQLPNPAELEALDKKDPTELELYRSPSSVADYYRNYLDLTMPVLIIYGGKDVLVPVSESMALFKKAFAQNRNLNAEFKVFEEADHSIQPLGSPYVLAGYPEFMRDWILRTMQKPSRPS